MKFFISGLGLDVGGGKTVGLNVVRSLPKVDPVNRYCLVFPKGCGYESLEPGPNCELELVDIRPKLRRRLYLDHLDLPRRCKESNADAALSMSNFSPWKMPCPHLVGVHLPHLLYPEIPAMSRLPVKVRFKLALQRVYFRAQARRVQGFCVLSPVMAERLNRYFKIPLEHIRVIPNAVAAEVDAPVRLRPELDEILRRCANRFRFCYVAPYYAHKNHRSLVPVMKILRDEYGVRDAVMLITIPDTGNPAARRFLHSVQKAGLSDQIVNAGKLPLNEVHHIYAQSHALFMPTQLECFSNTYVEAMHFGLPVLTSDMDFARSVCGDAAMYFNSEDPHDMAQSMMKIMTRPDLRVLLGETGRQRLDALEITWEEVTRMYVDALLAAAGQPRLAPQRRNCRTRTESGSRSAENAQPRMEQNQRCRLETKTVGEL
ncbi:MAG: glycosyltransferase family 1 protein [Planctomycetota bacterium]